MAVTTLRLMWRSIPDSKDQRSYQSDVEWPTYDIDSLSISEASVNVTCVIRDRNRYRCLKSDARDLVEVHYRILRSVVLIAAEYYVFLSLSHLTTELGGERANSPGARYQRAGTGTFLD